MAASLIEPHDEGPGAFARAVACAKDAAAIAERVVSANIAPCAAVGWAVRRPPSWGRSGDMWEVGVGEALSKGGGPLGLDAHGASALRGETAAFFDLASVTKSMTALAVARSTLGRTERLGEVLEEARGTASEAVSIEDLLAHRAGLEAHLPAYEVFAAQGVTAGAVRARRSEALRWVADARRADARGPVPRAGFSPIYSDLGYWLVGEALARRVGALDAGEAIERLVVRPLARDDELGTARGLSQRRTEFASRVVPTELGASGEPFRGIVHDENARAFGGLGGEGHAGMFGTASAVLAFGRAVHDALLHGEGPFASRTGEALSWLVRPRAGGTLRAGFDGKSAEGSSAGATVSAAAYGHLGFTGTSLWIDPDQEAVVVMLTNRVYPTRERHALRWARPIVHEALFGLAAQARTQAGQTR